MSARGCSVSISIFTAAVVTLMYNAGTAVSRSFLPQFSRSRRVHFSGLPSSFLCFLVSSKFTLTIDLSYFLKSLLSKMQLSTTCSIWLVDRCMSFAICIKLFASPAAERFFSTTLCRLINFRSASTPLILTGFSCISISKSGGSPFAPSSSNILTR